MAQVVVKMSRHRQRQRPEDHDLLTQQSSTNTVPDEAPPSPPDSANSTIHFTFDDEQEPWFAMQCRRHYKIMFCALLLLAAVLISIVVIVYYNVHAPPLPAQRKQHTGPPGITIMTHDVVHYGLERTEKPTSPHGNVTTPEPANVTTTVHESTANPTSPHGNVTTPEPANVTTTTVHEVPTISTPFELFITAAEDVFTIIEEVVANSSRPDAEPATSPEPVGNMTDCDNASSTVETLRTTERNTVVSKSMPTVKWYKEDKWYKEANAMDNDVPLQVRLPELNLTDHDSIAGRNLDRKIALLGLTSNKMSPESTATVMSITKTTLTFKQQPKPLIDATRYPVSTTVDLNAIVNATASGFNVTADVTVPVDALADVKAKDDASAKGQSLVNVTDIKTDDAELRDPIGLDNVTAAGVTGPELRPENSTADRGWYSTSESVNMSVAELMFSKGFTDSSFKILEAFQGLGADNDSRNFATESSTNVTLLGA